MFIIMPWMTFHQICTQDKVRCVMRARRLWYKILFPANYDYKVVNCNVIDYKEKDIQCNIELRVMWISRKVWKDSYQILTQVSLLLQCAKWKTRQTASWGFSKVTVLRVQKMLYESETLWRKRKQTAREKHKSIEHQLTSGLKTQWQRAILCWIKKRISSLGQSWLQSQSFHKLRRIFQVYWCLQGNQAHVQSGSFTKWGTCWGEKAY